MFRETSSHTGVYWHKGTGKWKAQTQHNGKSHHLGYFAEEEKAAAAYTIRLLQNRIRIITKL